MHQTPATYAITLQLSQEQQTWLDRTAKAYSEALGHSVSHSSLLMRLLELGLPKAEVELEELYTRRVSRSSVERRLSLVRPADY